MTTEEHDHSLKLALESNVSCDVCKKDIMKGPRQRCTTCPYNIHLRCSTNIGKFHEHPLQESDDSQILCNKCKTEIPKGSPRYKCTDKCEYNLHHRCVVPPPKMMTEVHSHPIQLAYESNVSCDVCQKDIMKGPIQRCTTCPYNIHLRCSTNIGKLHEHPLQESDDSQILCVGCQTEIPKGSPRYICTDKCVYNLHHRCAILPPKMTTEDYEESTELVPYLPFPDNSYSLVKHKFCKMESKARIINPLIHDHQLVLIKQVKEGAEVSSSGDLIKLMKKFKLTCKLCGQLITETPFYRCREECCINFFIHKWCADLPIKIEEAPCHTNHPLFLQPTYSQLFGSLGLFKCDVCGLWCDGFSFGCNECDFHVDMQCAFLLKNIKHKSHPLHPLRLSQFQTQKKSRKCVACAVTLYEGVFVYQCFKCNFYLHTECSVMPSKIRHRYEKDNYKLTYSPLREDLVYFCDICEQQIDTNQWFYDCDTCTQSVHAAFASCLKPRNKVLRLIRIGNHPHGFSLISTKQNTDCSVCDKPISTLPFFKCSTCALSVDSWCVPKMIRKSAEDELKSQLDNCLKLVGNQNSQSQQN